MTNFLPPILKVRHFKLELCQRSGGCITLITTVVLVLTSPSIVNFGLFHKANSTLSPPESSGIIVQISGADIQADLENNISLV
jgi:hypothetical protein